MASTKAVTRAVYGAFLVIASGFILSSVWQVAGTLFGAPPARAEVGAACAAGVRDLADAIERALAAAAAANDATTAEERYRAARRPEWDRDEEIARICTAEPAGAEALAALRRFDRAAEEAARKRSAELGPVRRDLESFIRGAP